MRLGLYGGTFDPVHFGHLLLAEQCREQCELDEVWFLPAARPPHKPDADISPAEHRTAMLELATAGADYFKISRMELDAQGVSYTCETLARVHAQEPDAELFFLMGGDSVSDLSQWREPARIAELATIVAVNRGDRSLPDRRELAAALGERIAGRVEVVSMPAVGLASSDIRARVNDGRSVRFMLPRAVEAYIAQHGLYV